MNPKAKKAAKTRAKNARFRAAKAKAREAAALSDKTLMETRAKAYARDGAPSLRHRAHGGEIAAMLFDDSDQGRFIFAITHLDDMLREFRARYYAEEFRS
jgi:hypothetical protein